MKRIAKTLLFLSLTILISCKKDNKKPNSMNPNETGKVMISGLEYPTEKIGNLDMDKCFYLLFS